MSQNDTAAPRVWVPSACTLPTVDQPLRVAEFDELFRTAVVGVRRVDPIRLELELRADATVAAKAAALDVHETGCCSFFSLTLTIADGSLTLEVRTPPDQTSVLDALAGVGMPSPIVDGVDRWARRR